MNIKYGVYELLGNRCVHLTNGELPETLSHSALVSSHATLDEAMVAAGLSRPASERHYPPGMGEESRRLHREYNALVEDVVRLTDECGAKGIVLVPGGENL